MVSCNLQIWTQKEGERGKHPVYFIYILSEQGIVMAISLTPTKGCVLYITNSVLNISILFAIALYWKCFLQCVFNVFPILSFYTWSV